VKKVVLLSCSKGKRNYPCEAYKLYDKSSLFKKSYAYAKQFSDDICILSAKYGLVELTEIVEPYDETLNDKTARELTTWAEKVFEQLRQRYVVDETNFIILAGQSYYKQLLKYLPNCQLPLSGMSFGVRLSKLQEWVQHNNNPEVLPRTDDEICFKMHNLFNKMPRYSYQSINKVDFDNGIYIVFENRETYHDMDRIVRIGTHNTQGRLKPRLKDHFSRENKDGSIFRKNVGKALLSRNGDSYLDVWAANSRNIDLISRQFGDRFDVERQRDIERKVSTYMRENFTFACFPVETVQERLRLEEGIISTLNSSSDFVSSENWLGRHHPVIEISGSGMWLVKGLNGDALSQDEFYNISMYVSDCHIGQKSIVAHRTDDYGLKYAEISNNNNMSQQMGIKEVTAYLINKLKSEFDKGFVSCTIKSGDLHSELKLISRMPTVCDAMCKLLQDGDIIHKRPPKGKGSNLVIEFFFRK
jgi:hypothetical protein